MLNKAIIMGRMTRDPELRHTQSNTAVCSFTLAVDRDRKGPNGERQTDFIDCVVWGRTAEFVSQWFCKGAMAIAVGRIQVRKWQDQNGNNRYATEVICDEVSFGESRKAREANGGYQGGGDMGYGAPRSQQAAPAPAPAFDLPTESTDFVDLGDEDEGSIPF